MVKYSVKLLAVLFSVSLLACSSTNNKPLLINFSADSSAVVFSNIDQPGLLALKNAQYPDSVLSELISVLQTPSEKDTALKEMPVKGRVLVTDSTIVFVPDKPFIKENDYLVIACLNVRFGNAEKIMKSDLDYRVKPLQKRLTR